MKKNKKTVGKWQSKIEKVLLKRNLKNRRQKREETI